MLWFKHWHNLRNSPPMKYIRAVKGDEGVAAAYRLLEVMTERCGSGANFNPILMLAPPYTEHWLACEILTPDEDYMAEPSTKQLTDMLDVFETGGLIQLGNETGQGRIKDKDGKWQPGEVTFTTLELCNFEEMQDTWTARWQHKGVGQGKGGGARTT